MKVLVIQPKIGMGDMILYLPYIHAIAKKHERSVSVLVKKNSRADELLAYDQHIVDTILLDRTKNNTGYHDGIKGFFRLIKDLKLRKIDKVFIFSSSLRYYLIAKLAGIKQIAHYPLFRKRDNLVLSAKIFTENELKEVISAQPVINLNKDVMKESFNKDYKHICIGFSASGSTKRWDVKNYIDLCEKINEKLSCKFYLAGGKNDQDLINQIKKSKIGHLCMSFENLKIKETLPIIKNCNLYIGNDTGWLHISSALGLKCLALFMDSPVLAYGKYSERISLVLPEGETEDSTTHNTRGKNRISFEEVYKKSIDLLN